MHLVQRSEGVCMVKNINDEIHGDPTFLFQLGVDASSAMANDTIYQIQQQLNILKKSTQERVATKHFEVFRGALCKELIIGKEPTYIDHPLH